jgi:cytochrome c2
MLTTPSFRQSLSFASYAAKVPGTAMPMQIPDDKIRADVVAYLATLKK